MEEVKKVVKKRTRRTDPEKRIATIDKQIAKLQAEKEALLKPIQAKKILEEAAKTMSPEEIAEKLGISIGE